MVTKKQLFELELGKAVTSLNPCLRCIKVYATEFPPLAKKDICRFVPENKNTLGYYKTEDGKAFLRCNPCHQKGQHCFEMNDEVADEAEALRKACAAYFKNKDDSRAVELAKAVKDAAISVAVEVATKIPEATYFHAHSGKNEPTDSGVAFEPLRRNKRKSTGLSFGSEDGSEVGSSPFKKPRFGASASSRPSAGRIARLENALEVVRSNITALKPRSKSAVSIENYKAIMDALKDAGIVD